MKKQLIIFSLLAAGIFVSCDKTRRNPGRTYMPDMAESRAYETYSATDNLAEKGINYTATPVEGTIARGDIASYPYKNDSLGYINSAKVANPLPPLDAVQYLEAARLYLVNCGICHGEQLDGNGPLWKGGDGPYTAAPKNLVTDELMTKMAEGTMFHSITYGRNLMGSYASQLSTKQRWMIVHYIKEKQKVAASGAAKPAAADATK